MELSGQFNACRFTSTERAPGTHLKRGWVGPRVVMDAVVKRKIPSPRRESNSRTPIVRPVASLYTDLTQCHAMKTYGGGGSGVQLHAFLTSKVVKVVSAPGNHLIGGWVGPLQCSAHIKYTTDITGAGIAQSV
jgi:hypothetical protein